MVVKMICVLLFLLFRWLAVGPIQKDIQCGVARNRTVYERLSTEFGNLGMENTWQQCRSKIKSVTFRYRKVCCA